MRNKRIRKYVVVEDHLEAIFCTGIFDDYWTALGCVMDSVWDFKESYKNEGDIFHYTEMEPTDCDGGMMMTLTFKHHGWKEEHKHNYYILFMDNYVDDESEDEND